MRFSEGSSLRRISSVTYNSFMSGATRGGSSTLTADAIIVTFFSRSSSLRLRFLFGKGIL